MVPQVIFQNRKPDRIATIDEYRQSGGYQALTKALQKHTPKEVQQIVIDANLQGRGGGRAQRLRNVAESGGRLSHF